LGLFRQERSQRDPTQAGSAVCEKLPTVEQMASGVGQLMPHGVVPLSREFFQG